MKLKSLLPWLCVLGLLAGLGWMYADSQKKAAELAALREESQQLQQLRAELEEAKTNQVQTESDELTRLRKDNEELLRLRNEVRQLRGDKQRLATQLQTARVASPGPARQPGTAGIAGAVNPAAQAASNARAGLAATNSEQAIIAACINNLRLIDGAKQQWALEHQKPRGALLTTADLMPYLKGNTMPVCPAGGVYTLNPVGIRADLQHPRPRLAQMNSSSISTFLFRRSRLKSIPFMNDIDIESLKGIANQLRIHSIEATTAAGSGHPTSCCSAADLVAALFFGHMRYDPKNPHYYNNDRFILSKGHAAPLLYAAWAETGLFPVEELLKLRQLGSDLEGHPTPRLPFADVATGSLGQGLSVGVGMALCARLDNLDYRTYVLMGDGECAEGSVWEAASLAGIYHLNNLIAVVDVNRLGQSQPTALGHDLDAYKKRFEGFGWRTEEIDGHDLEEILEVLAAVGLGASAAGHPRQDSQGRRRLVPPGHGRLARQSAFQRGSGPRDCRAAAHRQIRHRPSHPRAEPTAGAEK